MVDETILKDGLKAMVAAVAFDGRALPVAWRRCPNEKWPMGLVELTAKTLGWVRESRDELGGGRKAFDDLSDAPGTSWRHRARAFKKSGMASGAREQALAGDGAVVRVDGGLGRRGVRLGQGGERSGGRQVAGGARRPVQAPA